MLMFTGDNNMHAKFKPLSYSDLSNNTQLAHSSNTAVQEDSALVVMTDLNKIKAFTIEATASIEFANSKMIACGVRLLFVMNADDVLVGLITASDLFGETPITHMQKHGGLGGNRSSSGTNRYYHLSFAHVSASLSLIR